MVCDYIKDRALTVDMLWEVVYRVFREALHPDSLEDFNATDMDLMEIKDNILSIWKSRDKHKTSSLRPMFVPLSVRASKKKSILGDTFFTLLCHGTCTHLPEPFLWIELCCRWDPVIPHKACGSTTRDLLSLSIHALWAGCSSHSRICSMGISHGYNFGPMMGQPLRPADILSCHSHQTYSPPLPFT